MSEEKTNVEKTTGHDSEGGSGYRLQNEVSLMSYQKSAIRGVNKVGSPAES